MPQFPLPSGPFVYYGLISSSSLLGFPSSFTPEEPRFPVFPYYNANRLAVKAGGFASKGRTASTVPARQPRGGQSRGGWFRCVSTATRRWMMLLPTAAWADAQGKPLSPQNQVMQCPRGSGEGRGEGVLVFSKCQSELHCVHQEVVQIMENNGSLGL